MSQSKEYKLSDIESLKNVDDLIKILKTQNVNIDELLEKYPQLKRIIEKDTEKEKKMSFMDKVKSKGNRFLNFVKKHAYATSITLAVAIIFTIYQIVLHVGKRSAKSVLPKDLHPTVDKIVANAPGYEPSTVSGTTKYDQITAWLSNKFSMLWAKLKGVFKTTPEVANIEDVTLQPRRPQQTGQIKSGLLKYFTETLANEPIGTTSQKIGDKITNPDEFINEFIKEHPTGDLRSLKNEFIKYVIDKTNPSAPTLQWVQQVQQISKQQPKQPPPEPTEQEKKEAEKQHETQMTAMEETQKQLKDILPPQTSTKELPKPPSSKIKKTKKSLKKLTEEEKKEGKEHHEKQLEEMSELSEQLKFPSSSDAPPAVSKEPPSPPPIPKKRLFGVPIHAPLKITLPAEINRIGYKNKYGKWANNLFIDEASFGQMDYEVLETVVIEFIKRSSAGLTVENFRTGLKDFIKEYYEKGVQEKEEMMKSAKGFIPHKINDINPTQKELVEKLLKLKQPQNIIFNDTKREQKMEEPKKEQSKTQRLLKWINQHKKALGITFLISSALVAMIIKSMRHSKVYESDTPKVTLPEKIETAQHYTEYTPSTRYVYQPQQITENELRELHYVGVEEIPTTQISTLPEFEHTESLRTVQNPPPVASGFKAHTINDETLKELANKPEIKKDVETLSSNPEVNKIIERNKGNKKNMFIELMIWLNNHKGLILSQITLGLLALFILKNKKIVSIISTGIGRILFKLISRPLLGIVFFRRFHRLPTKYDLANADVISNLLFQAFILSNTIVPFLNAEKVQSIINPEYMKEKGEKLAYLKRTEELRRPFIQERYDKLKTLTEKLQYWIKFKPITEAEVEEKYSSIEDLDRQIKEVNGLPLPILPKTKPSSSTAPLASGINDKSFGFTPAPPINDPTQKIQQIPEVNKILESNANDQSIMTRFKNWAKRNKGKLLSVGIPTVLIAMGVVANILKARNDAHTASHEEGSQPFGSWGKPFNLFGGGLNDKMNELFNKLWTYDTFRNIFEKERKPNKTIKNIKSWLDTHANVIKPIIYSMGSVIAGLPLLQLSRGMFDAFLELHNDYTFRNFMQQIQHNVSHQTRANGVKGEGLKEIKFKFVDLFNRLWNKYPAFRAIFKTGKAVKDLIVDLEYWLMKNEHIVMLLTSLGISSPLRKIQAFKYLSHALYYTYELLHTKRLFSTIYDWITKKKPETPQTAKGNGLKEIVLKGSESIKSRIGKLFRWIKNNKLSTTGIVMTPLILGIIINELRKRFGVRAFTLPEYMTHFPNQYLPEWHEQGRFSTKALNVEDYPKVVIDDETQALIDHLTSQIKEHGTVTAHGLNDKVKPLESMRSNPEIKKIAESPEIKKLINKNESVETNWKRLIKWMAENKGKTIFTLILLPLVIMSIIFRVPISRLLSVLPVLILDEGIGKILTELTYPIRLYHQWKRKKAKEKEQTNVLHEASELSGKGIIKGGQLTSDYDDFPHKLIDSSQIEKLGFKWFMNDELNKINSLPDGAYILNLDKSNGQGTHWTSFIIDSKSKILYYIDPFGEILNGLPPQSILNLSKKMKLKIFYNKNTYQPVKSNLCGHFALYTAFKLRKKLQKGKLTGEKIQKFLTKMFGTEPDDKIIKKVWKWSQKYIPDVN